MKDRAVTYSVRARRVVEHEFLVSMGDPRQHVNLYGQAEAKLGPHWHVQEMQVVAGPVIDP